MTRATTCAVVGAAVLAATPLDAQVGHPPDASPYRDLEHRQELTVFAGVMRSAKDPVGVAYRGGPMAGVRYQLYVGGPAYLVGRLSAVQSERLVLDPGKPVEERVIGDVSGTQLFADVGLELSLTGHKSWHGLSPVINGGGGIGADFKSRDPGGFRFGTPFALTFGTGVRWTNGGRLQARVDVGDFLYRVTYPETFYRGTVDDPALLASNVARSRWTHNGALTFGLSYLFGR